ncbi:YbjN domain-containing protein [Luteimicrobium subarcticum]|uniref:Putative sensory transduction regulator n=1 Tax=Luteimicrobium subarcticum TaxID=620910 RepID=A0A2M8WTV2_9MICO|nr:YbjN domain-containing protein [Luteimicrobium subarcticum]PJI94371.1 putative sensory transduction regulator [Luteimicrobium subarcticum]
MRPQTGWLGRLLRNATKGPAEAPHESDVPTPVTTERIAAFLTRRGYRFRIDDDGDITGTWEGHRFWFLLLGPHGTLLQVRGRWARTVGGDERLGVLQAANDWNRDRIWPKVYLREEDGGLGVYGEVSVDLEHGATDDQLGQVVSCGLGTGVQLFSALSALLPGQEDLPEE